MFIIMKEDKSLTVSKSITIYQREKLVDKIRFIIPQFYEDIDLSECKLILKYKNQIGEPRSEILVKSDEMYKDCLQYILPLDTKFTQLSGDITMRLTFVKVGLDGEESNILHTGNTTIHIIAVDDWYQYIPDNSLEIIDNLIIKNEKQIQELKKISTEYDQSKADDLSYENGVLQLLAKGEKIGKSVVISTKTDSTLSLENVAADAKAVGDKFTEFDNKKLDKNLGKTYANKILGIDSEGNIVPKENIELDYNNVKNKPSINSVELLGNKTLDELGIQKKGEYALKTELPKNTSQLNNDSGFLTSVPEEYITDYELSAKQFATKSELPKKVSELQNDSGFISKVPDEYITEAELTGKGYALKTDIPKSLPASDVSAWAKEPQKPVYTASEVGADSKGSASTAEQNSKKYTDSSLETLKNESDGKYALKTEIVKVDLTLTQSGKAPDSKAVGDKFKEVETTTNELKRRLDDLSYVKIAFSSASINKATNEIGSTVTDVTANWKLNKTPKTLKIQFGSESQETLENTVTTKSYTGKSVKANTNIVITATDDRNATATKSLTIAFQPKVYWGVADNKPSYSSADILGLSNSALATSRQRTLSVNATAGKHIIYAIPSNFGTPVFNVGGFDGGFVKVGTVSHTNASGHTQNYDVWKSVNAGLGSVSVLVK